MIHDAKWGPHLDDCPGMGGCSGPTGPTKDERIAALESELAALREREAALAKLLEWVVGDHNAPSDCFSTGPMTGTPKDDLCPACAAVQYLESNKLSNAILARDREKDEKIAALSAERDALAVRLGKVRGLAATAASYEVDAAYSLEPDSDVFGCVGVPAKSIIAKAKRAWAEFDAVVDGEHATIVEEIRREAAIEALRKLPGCKVPDEHGDPFARSYLSSTAIGWNDYHRAVLAAIAALEAQNG